jgi:hypothetical protein
MEYLMPPRQQKKEHFGGLDGPAERQLRVSYERHMWSFGPALRERYRDLLDHDPPPGAGQVLQSLDEFVDPHYEPAPEPLSDEELDRQTRLEMSSY